MHVINAVNLQDGQIRSEPGNTVKENGVVSLQVESASEPGIMIRVEINRMAHVFLQVARSTSQQQAPDSLEVRWNC